jgi:hypothetical protein
MVACATFQLLYMLLWNWSFWLLWTVRFCIVMLSSTYTTLRVRFLNIFVFGILIWSRWTLPICDHVCLHFCSLFVLLSSPLFSVDVTHYLLVVRMSCFPCAVPCVWWVAMLFCFCVLECCPFVFRGVGGYCVSCCCWFVQCLVRSCAGLDLGNVCFCQFLASPQPLFSMLVVLIIEDFFCYYSHLVMYYNSMIPQVSKLCFGSIISNSCTNISANVLQMGVPLGPPFSCS